MVVLNVPERLETGRITVGSHPCGLAVHPTGRWIVVANRYSNFLSVIDVQTDAVVSEIPVPFYCEDLVFSAEGDVAYVSNFWKNQVLVVDLTVSAQRLSGRLRPLGFNRKEFFGETHSVTNFWRLCDACGWQEQVSEQVAPFQESEQKCRRCGHSPVRHAEQSIQERTQVGLSAILRASCGTSGCHLYRTGDFYAGPNDAEIFRSATVHSFPGDPNGSPLLRAVTSVRDGGWADSVDGLHHAGGVVFKDLANNPDYARLRKWIAKGVAGPGISVGQKPRDLAVSADGTTLYVANTGSADISVIDLIELRETGRIFTRSAVNDIHQVDGHLVLASLGLGSGHPKAHDAGRESSDRDHPQAEFTLYRDLATGKPLPLAEQQPLGPFDNVDGTAQEKFRDITNDLILLDPSVEQVAAYRATDRFTRYTSDSYEALPGDKK
ncbi:MAG: YncE family protein, partial [Myxococcota bacterium]